jgi:ABC-2 type transport system ATP-binding protein
VDGATVRFDVDGNATDAVLRHLASLRVDAITAHPPTLEELFLRHYRTDIAADHEDETPR